MPYIPPNTPHKACCHCKGSDDLAVQFKYTTVELTTEINLCQPCTVHLLQELVPAIDRKIATIQSACKFPSGLVNTLLYLVSVQKIPDTYKHVYSTKHPVA